MVPSLQMDCRNSTKLDDAPCRPSSASSGTRIYAERTPWPRSVALEKAGKLDARSLTAASADPGFKAVTALGKLDARSLRKLDALSEPRRLSKLVSDIAQGIQDLELPAFRRSRSNSVSDPSEACSELMSEHSFQLPMSCHNSMAGSASRAMLKQRSLERSQSLSSMGSQSSCSRQEPRLAEKTVKANALKQVFRSFAMGREQMYWRNFESLCSSSLLFDSQFMVPDARRIFDNALVEGRRSIGLEKFEQLLSDVAFHRQCTVDQVHRMVKKCSEHRLRGH